MNDFDEMPTMNVIHLLALKDNEIFDLKKALGWYADENNHEVNVTNQWEPVLPINQDRGKRARQALKGNQ